MRNISHHKTRENFIKTLFRATKTSSWLFGGAKKAAFVSLFILMVALGSYYVYAQTENRSLYKIETIHIFPDKVTTEGWMNVSQIGTQNLEEVSLYQEFNELNSAYIDISKHPAYLTRHRASDRSAAESASASTTPLVETLGQPASVLSENTNSVPASSTDETSSKTVDDVGKIISDTDSSTTDEAAVDELPVVPTATNTVSVSEKATSLLSFAFSMVTEWLPFTQSGTTSQSTEATTTETVPGGVVSEETTNDLLNTTTVESTAATSSSTTEAKTRDTVADLPPLSTSTATTTQPAQPEIPSGSTTTQSVHTDDNEVAAAEVVDAPLCERDCAPYTITLSGFGLPIFDDAVQVDGAQLRVSFAAKQRATRDEIQGLTIRYSFDDGTTWESGGEIIIDDETSNSINGGYYLFALPPLADPALLDQLMVELRYENDPRALEGIYVDGVWLEMFTIQPPDFTDVDISALLSDTNYDPSVLTGDQLVLDDGTVVHFENTDENSDETLIIKSDQVSYSGLSSAVTYFSITNTDSSEETFALKTYFPDDVGSVVNLEEWNPNKPINTVIPEYQSYVYHCEAGWELTNNPIGKNLFDISRLLTPLASTSLNTSSTQSVEIDSTNEIDVPATATTSNATITTTQIDPNADAVSAPVSTTTDAEPASTTDVQAVVHDIQAFAH